MGKRKKEDKKEEANEQVVSPHLNPDAINTEDDAVEFVRLNYTVPDNVKVVYVTEDKQVFFKRNPATAHANNNNKKLYSIKWL